MEPHQQRVVDEKAELDMRRSKLAAFFYSDTYPQVPPDERALLEKQFRVMTQYSDILGERIAAFNL